MGGSPPIRHKCKHCKKLIKSNKFGIIQKYSAKLFITQLENQIPPDGIPYNFQTDFFCGKCKCEIRPTGRSLLYPNRSSTKTVQHSTTTVAKNSAPPAPTSTADLPPDDNTKPPLCFNKLLQEMCTQNLSNKK